MHIPLLWYKHCFERAQCLQSGGADRVVAMSGSCPLSVLASAEESVIHASFPPILVHHDDDDDDARCDSFGRATKNNAGKLEFEIRNCLS